MELTAPANDLGSVQATGGLPPSRSGDSCRDSPHPDSPLAAGADGSRRDHPTLFQLSVRRPVLMSKLCHLACSRRCGMRAQCIKQCSFCSRGGWSLLHRVWHRVCKARLPHRMRRLLLLLVFTARGFKLGALGPSFCSRPTAFVADRT